MAGWGNTFRKALNDLVYKGSAFTSPNGVIYIGLHIGDPGPDGQTANEVSGNGYQAKATAASDWNVGTLADPSVVTNANAITFATPTGSWGLVTYFSQWNHLTNRAPANFIGANALLVPVTVSSGVPLSFPPSSLAHSFDSV